MSDKNANNDQRKNAAYRKGYNWGNEFQEIDYDGAWCYDGDLMASYLDGCRAGSWASKQGFKIAWRERV